MDYKKIDKEIEHLEQLIGDIHKKDKITDFIFVYRTMTEEYKVIDYYENSFKIGALQKLRCL